MTTLQADNMFDAVRQTPDIVLWLEDREVGRLSLKEGKLHFEGDADSSARVFMALLAEYWLSNCRSEAQV